VKLGATGFIVGPFNVVVYEPCEILIRGSVQPRSRRWVNVAGHHRVILLASRLAAYYLGRLSTCCRLCFSGASLLLI